MRNAREVTIKMKSGYVALYVICDTMKTVFISTLSHPVIFSDYINGYFNRLYILPFDCMLYIRLNFLVFRKRFHTNTESWLKFS